MSYTMRRIVWRVSLVGVCIAVAHALVQFWAWGMAGLPGLVWPWRVISFPAFAITPSFVSQRFFWPVFLANSFTWGFAAAAFIMRRLRNRIL